MSRRATWRSAAVATVLVTTAAMTTLAACGSPARRAAQASPSNTAQAPVSTYLDSGGGSDAGATASPGPAASDQDPATKAELVRVHVLSVGIGAGGQYVSVQFKAPPRLARTWQPGMLYVVDERTKRVYDHVPTVPVLGTLLGKPVREGQTGYVMLVNTAPGLRSGDVVTVVLGAFRQRHVHIS